MLLLIGKKEKLARHFQRLRIGNNYPEHQSLKAQVNSFEHFINTKEK